MQLRIKQRVFSWTDTYDVYDEYGVPRYFVKAEIFALGHHIHVYRKDTGEEVGSIHQRPLTFLPKFDIEIAGQMVGTVSKQLTLFRPVYEVDYQNWSVQGDVLEWNYQVLQGSREIMSIRKQWLSWGDTYVLNCRDSVHELPGLLIVLAIDAANCED